MDISALFRSKPIIVQDILRIDLCSRGIKEAPFVIPKPRMIVIHQNIKTWGGISGDNNKKMLRLAVMLHKTTEKQVITTVLREQKWNSKLAAQFRQYNVTSKASGHRVQTDWTQTGQGARFLLPRHASISPLVGHVASLTSILFECVAHGYYNLICKPLHGSYVTAGMNL